MKAKPIIFSGPMVRAILDGRKTQTRRIVKPRSYICDVEHGIPFEMTEDGPQSILSPYQPGDLLWVREAFRYVRTLGVAGAEGDPEVIEYRCGPEVKSFQKGIWKPSIHMPREASRITLEVTNVRCERLQDISEADAIAEGVERFVMPNSGRVAFQNYNKHAFDYCDKALSSFASLWQSIHGPDSWNANPFVWVYEFRRVKP